jgi:excisionase family DNA binding protein
LFSSIFNIHLSVKLLTGIVQDNSVKLMPIDAELTIQEAADALNVSRDFLVNLLEDEIIPYFKVDNHRRIFFKDIMAYKQKIDTDRLKVLEELAAQAQALDMGY